MGIMNMGVSMGGNIVSYSAALTEPTKKNKPFNIQLSEDDKDIYNVNDEEEEEEEEEEYEIEGKKKKKITKSKTTLNPPNQGRRYILRNTTQPKQKGETVQVMNAFETDYIPFEDLDSNIEAPNKINLDDYNITASSLYQSDYNPNEQMIKPNEHILNSTARSFISSNSISRGEAISQSHSHIEDSNYYNNNINNINNPIKNKTGLDLLLLKQFNEKLPEQIFYNTNNPHHLSQIDQTEEYEDEMSSGFGNSFNNNAKEVEINSNKREYLQKLYESKEYNDFKNNFCYFESK